MKALYTLIFISGCTFPMEKVTIRSTVEKISLLDALATRNLALYLQLIQYPHFADPKTTYYRSCREVLNFLQDIIEKTKNFKIIQKDIDDRFALFAEKNSQLLTHDGSDKQMSELLELYSLKFIYTISQPDTQEKQKWEALLHALQNNDYDALTQLKN
jgi:hypothetical protein